jgi:multiple sugar transport system substrate-binding protein
MYWRLPSVAALAVSLALVASTATDARVADTTCDGHISGPNPTYISVWFHAGSGPERATMNEQVKAFNALKGPVRVRLVVLPQSDYDQQVASAAASGNLPDVLDFDGPFLYNYAWTGKIKPLDSCIPTSLRADLIPSVREEGTYAGRMWGIGTFDSGMALYVRPSILKKAGIRIPTGPANAWTAAEFTQILAKLQQAGYKHPLDVSINFAVPPNEWDTYGFAPAVWSAGGDLIDRANYRTVEGYLNGAPAVKALTYFQQWEKAGYIDPNKDDAAFDTGRSPISWRGHWVFDEYTKAHPGDVELAPLPNFGVRTATGMGSWMWGISANATDGDAAWSFISFLMRSDEIRRMTLADGAVPATRSAIALSPRFAPGGPEHLFVEQLEDGVATPRPQTPAYPTLSAAFASAFVAIVIHDRPVKQTLDAAARRVQKTLVANRYYPPPAP